MVTKILPKNGLNEFANIVEPDRTKGDDVEYVINIAGQAKAIVDANSQ